MKDIVTLLASGSFLEKALLLLLAAILTGILIPIVKSRMEQASFEKKRTFDALLARQSDVIKAQTKFLTDFSNHIWEYHKISQRVSYNHLLRDEKSYQKAVREYQDSLWELLQKIRSDIGAARWFTSDAAHQALTSWYEKWFIGLEQSLRQLIQTNPEDKVWSEHHTGVHIEASKRNYGLLRFLAKDFGLRAIVEPPDRTETPAKN